MRDDLFGELRGVLAHKPTTERFEQICRLLDDFGFEVGAVRYLEEQFARWPVEIRREPPSRWWKRFLADGWLAWLPLCNHLQIAKEQDRGLTVYERLAASPGLSRITSMEIAGGIDPLMERGMAVLSKSPHSRHLVSLQLGFGITAEQVHELLGAWYSEKLETLVISGYVEGAEVVPGIIADREASRHLRSLALHYLHSDAHIGASEEEKLELGRTYEPLARSPHLRGLEELSFVGEELTARQLEVFAREGVFEHILSLRLEDMTFPVAALHAIFTNLTGGSLRKLSLGCAFDEDDAELSWEGIELGELEHLSIERSIFPPAALGAICDAVSRSSTLKVLDCTSSSARDKHLRQVMSSDSLAHASLEQLWMRDCVLTPRALESLDPAVSWPALRYLDLARNRLGDEGVTALAHGLLDAPSLETLDLETTGLTDAGLAELSTSPLLSSVRRLKLGDNAITEEGWLALMRSPTLRELESFSLQYEEVSVRLMQALIESEAFARVTSIRFYCCWLEPGVMQLLAEAPALKRLERLQVEYQSLTEDDFMAFARTPSRPNLHHLHLALHNEFERPSSSQVICSDEVVMALLGGKFPLLERLYIPYHHLRDETLEVLLASRLLGSLVEGMVRDELEARAAKRSE